jgi:F-type H+-transporting ATPase subunit epsilon
LKNAKSDVDIARAQSELAVIAAEMAALRRYLQKK